MNNKLFALGLLAVISLVACKKSETTTPTVSTETNDTVSLTKPETDTTHTATSEGIGAHNSQNSVDWMGTYEAVVPCADCAGIKTNLTLNKDNTFTISEEYLEKKSKNEDKGTFSWDATGSIISLKGKSTNYQYKVGENTLFMLDTEGKEIQGALKEHYIFKKK
ncbi:MAG: copper resistance protein NlpE N-terminal domain-containing protein [Chryseobacterium sp.]|nr:copper resistance protein NlpE N-terminal domain-containing protein [Candidatus Chryseobacterium enterohippi]